MLELRPLLKKTPAEKAAIKKKPKSNPEKVEFYKQGMEVVIEVAEQVLWNKKYRKLGAPELVDLIIKKAEKEGSELSKQQRASINKKVLQWTIDVADQMQAIDFLVREAQSRVDLSEDDALKLEKESQKLQSEPWQLLATNKLVQTEFLKYLPVENKNPDDYEFNTETYPLVLIVFKRGGDYDEVVKNTNIDKRSFRIIKCLIDSSGLAPHDSCLVKGRPECLKVFDGKVGLIRNLVTKKSTIVHEAQHLLYANYILSEKEKYLSAINELAAYLKGGKYIYDERAVFGSEAFNDSGYFYCKYEKPCWSEIKQELALHELAGTDPKKLVTKVSLADNLTELLSILKRVRPSFEKQGELIIDNEQKFLAYLGLEQEEIQNVHLDVSFKEDNHYDSILRFYNILIFNTCENIRRLEDFSEEGFLFYLIKILTEFKDYSEVFFQRFALDLNGAVFYGEEYTLKRLLIDCFIEMRRIIERIFYEHENLKDFVEEEAFRDIYYRDFEIEEFLEQLNNFYKRFLKMLKRVEEIDEELNRERTLFFDEKIDWVFYDNLFEKYLNIKGVSNLDYSSQIRKLGELREVLKGRDDISRILKWKLSWFADKLFQETENNLFI